MGGKVKHNVNRVSVTKAISISVYAVFLMAVTTPAGAAEEYQDYVVKAFPSFKILNRTDFTEEIQNTVKTNPALVTGRFNNDDLKDFAAIIVDRSKPHGQQAGRKYYHGKYVVCHGAEKDIYRCQILKEVHIYLPYEWYLYREGPGKVGCIIDQNLTEAETTLQRDAIGWILPDRSSGIYVYQPDGTYSGCLTGD